MNVLTLVALIGSVVLTAKGVCDCIATLTTTPAWYCLAGLGCFVLAVLFSQYAEEAKR